MKGEPLAVAVRLLVGRVRVWFWLSPLVPEIVKTVIANVKQRRLERMIERATIHVDLAKVNRENRNIVWTE